MKRKGLALLLAALMTIGTIPATAVSAFASEPDQIVEPAPADQGQGGVQDPAIQAANEALASGEAEESVTPGQVHDALDTAIDSEVDASLEFGVLTPGGVAEIAAGVNDAEADDALDAAEIVTGLSDGFTDAAADVAEEHAETAGQEAQAAKENADTAVGAADTAAAAKENAQNAGTAEEAAAAAAEAQAASVEAQRAANDALVHAQNASEEAQKAEIDYELAKAAYDAAKAETDRQLAQGLIDAKQAEAITAEAARLADEAYEVMAAAQAAAEQALSDAKAKADAADQDLQEKINALEQVIVENGANIISKTGTAALTGAALLAAKLAAEATKLEVSYYEGRIEAKEEALEELNEKIDAAQEAIDAAQAVVDEKQAALDKADEDYADKAAELERAKEELAAAQDLIDNLGAIAEERERAQIQGVADALSAIRDGSASTEQKQNAAAYVLGNASKYSQDAEDVTIKEWVSDDIFSVEGEDGNDRYYKVITKEVKNENGEVTDRYLQFVEFVPAHTETVTDYPDEEETWEAGEEISSEYLDTVVVRTTDMTAHEGTSAYPVTLKRTSVFGITGYEYQIEVNGKTYELEKDEKGFFYTVKSGFLNTTKTRHDVTVDKEVGETVGDEAGSSSSVTDLWDKADHAEENLSEKQTAQEAAAQAVSDAAAVQQGAAEALADAKSELTGLQSGQAVDIQKAEELKQELRELNEELNGGLAEQLAVAFLDNGLDGVNSALASNVGTVLGEEEQARYDGLRREIEELNARMEASSSMVEKAIIAAQITTKEAQAAAIIGRELLNADLDLDQIREQGEALAEVLKVASDNELNLDDVGAVVNLLTNAGLSAKTKEFIAGKIVDALAELHHDAVEDLKQAVGEGLEELGSAAFDVVEAGKNVISAHAAVIVAKGAKSLADALAEDAAQKKAAADQAAKDAAEAAALYEKLIGTYGPDNADVQRARDAADAAKESARIAAEEAARAQDAADRAKEDYKAAQDAADEAEEAGSQGGESGDQSNDPTGKGGDGKNEDGANNGEGKDQSRDSGSDDQGQNGEDGNKAAEDRGTDGNADSRGQDGGSEAMNNALASGALFSDAVRMTLPEYAASLRGTRYAEIVGSSEDTLNSKAFVDHVYSHFNIFLDLDGESLEDIAVNGTLVGNDDREPGDLLVLTDETGAVTGFGVNYDKETFVQFNEETGLVEMTATETLNGSYGAVRVV